MSKARPGAAMPPAPRKTLLEWIDQDDASINGCTQPACSDQVQALHAKVCEGPRDAGDGSLLEPPPGLRLAPLG
jgi:hypothetical protein